LALAAATFNVRLDPIRRAAGANEQPAGVDGLQSTASRSSAIYHTFAGNNPSDRLTVNANSRDDRLVCAQRFHFGQRHGCYGWQNIIFSA